MRREEKNEKRKNKLNNDENCDIEFKMEMIVSVCQFSFRLNFTKELCAHTQYIHTYVQYCATCCAFTKQSYSSYLLVTEVDRNNNQKNPLNKSIDLFKFIYIAVDVQ